MCETAALSVGQCNLGKCTGIGLDLVDVWYLKPKHQTMPGSSSQQATPTHRLQVTAYGSKDPQVSTRGHTLHDDWRCASLMLTPCMPTYLFQHLPVWRSQHQQPLHLPRLPCTHLVR